MNESGSYAVSLLLSNCQNCQMFGQWIRQLSS